MRFLSRAGNGTLCFGYNGEIYTLADGGKPEKVRISIVNDNINHPSMLRLGSVNEMAFSDDGKEIILQSRGEVFATTGEYSTTKQISRTAAAEEGTHQSGPAAGTSTRPHWPMRTNCISHTLPLLMRNRCSRTMETSAPGPHSPPMARKWHS